MSTKDPLSDVDDFPRLDDLLCGRPLWEIRLPVQARISRMRKLRDEIEKEYQRHLDDNGANHIDCGVLLGALNLIDGLLDEEEGSLESDA